MMGRQPVLLANDCYLYRDHVISVQFSPHTDQEYCELYKDGALKKSFDSMDLGFTDMLLNEVARYVDWLIDDCSEGHDNGRK